MYQAPLASSVLNEEIVCVLSSFTCICVCVYICVCMHTFRLQCSLDGATFQYNPCNVFNTDTGCFKIHVSLFLPRCVYACLCVCYIECPCMFSVLCMI